MADKSPAFPITGVVRCRLTVARVKVAVVRGPLVAFVPGLIVIPATRPPPPPPIALLLIPFRTHGDGMKVSGEFSTLEWRVLVRGLSHMPHRLFSGVLISVTQQEDLIVIHKSDEYGGSLRRRDLKASRLKALEAKLVHESKCIAPEMQQRAKRHWATKWKAETEDSAGCPDEDGDAHKRTVAAGRSS